MAGNQELDLLQSMRVTFAQGMKSNFECAAAHRQALHRRAHPLGEIRRRLPARRRELAGAFLPVCCSLALALAQRFAIEPGLQIGESRFHFRQTLRYLRQINPELARCGMHRIEPGFDLAQPLRIQIQAALIVAQAVNRLLQLDLRRLERSENLLQAGVEIGQSIESRIHRRDRGQR